VENIILQHIYSGNGVPNFILSESPEFCRRYDKAFWYLFFWTHCIYIYNILSINENDDDNKLKNVTKI